MQTTRRAFLKSTILTAGAGNFASSLLSQKTVAASFLVKKPRMKLGTVTYNLAKDWDVPTIIKNCEASHFEGVELRTSHAHKVEVNLSAEERAKVKKQFQDSKVELMGLGSTFEFHSPNPEELKKNMDGAREYMKLARDVGAGGIKVRPNALPKEVPVPKTLEQIGRSLHELGGFAQDLGLQIRLEVHGSGTANVPYIKTILDHADHKNVGITWNSNPSDLDGEGFDHNFNLVKNKIFEVHLRDLFIEDYPFRKLFAGLNEIGFSGYCLAEIPPSSDPVRVMQYFRGIWLAYQGLL